MSIFVQGTDATFAQKLRHHLNGNKRFSYNPKAPTDDFIIEHYAGQVPYSPHKFLDKNKDTISPGETPLNCRSLCRVLLNSGIV